MITTTSSLEAEIAERFLSPEQALQWNSKWSESDLRLIRENFERLNVVSGYIPPSGGYVGCMDATGTRVMTLSPGYVEFKVDRVPSEIEHQKWPGIGLSTFQPRDGAGSSALENHDVCTGCFFQLPLTGVCDNCD